MQNISEIIQNIPSRVNYQPQQIKTIPNHFRLFSTIIDNNLEFNFIKCLEFIQLKGNEIFGKKFKIHKSDHQLIYLLLIYAIRDKENAIKHNIDLQKGIMLSGPIGCGKTSLMKLLRFFLFQYQSYTVKSCREISFEFINKGFEVIHKYGSQVPNGSKPKTICFDDLGTEQNLKYFGNECNIMAEILLSRYDRFISQGTLTHITTNLSAGEIETYYGNRVRSRMREMFNLISFSTYSKDKRV